MKMLIDESQFERLDGFLKPYYKKIIQFKDEYLPEWKKTIVPGFHIDKGRETRIMYELKDPLPSSTGSDFGSYHWFITLMARHLHTGEFLKEKTPDEAILKIWGEDLYKTSREILAWFKLFEKHNDINRQS